MTTIRDEITINIGNLIGKGANLGKLKWDYAGYIYINSGDNSPESEFFVFKDGNRIDLDDDEIWDEAMTNFSRLREIIRVDGDDYWIRCLAVVKNEGKKFKILFEFDDASRWEITPANARDAYKIVIGDVFPEVLE